MTSQPTSLLIVSASLNVGGAQRFTSTLLRHLDRDRFRPSLALLRTDIGFPMPDDIDVHELNYRGITDFFGAANRLRRIIEKCQPDVVLSNIAAMNLLTGMALRKSNVLPKWIARIGNNPQQHDGWIRSMLARRVYPNADQFVVNSSGLVNELIARYGIPRERIDVIGNPTDFAEIDQRASQSPEFEWNGEHPLLIAVGRLFEQKRYDVMIDAFDVVRSNSPAHLWICGEGPCRRSLKRRIRRSKLSHDIELLGYCSNPHALMRQADLFLMSSDHEGLPNAMIEAQSLGLPAISTRCPHGPEEIILDGDTGLLTPTGDAKSLAYDILSLLENAELRREMGVAAKEHVRECFDVNDLSARWETLIERVAGVDLERESDFANEELVAQ